MDCEILIQHGSKVYQPIVQEGIQWETERKGIPGKLSFKVLKDDTLNFTEGDAVRLKVDGSKVFYGFVFAKKRDREQVITVTAYDHLRLILTCNAELWKIPSLRLNQGKRKTKVCLKLSKIP